MTVNIIVDIALVVIMIAGVFIGLKKGFLATVAKPVKIALAVLLAFHFAANLSATVIKPLIAAPITNQLATHLTTRFSEITAETVDTLPTVIKLAAGLCGIDIAEVAASSGDGSVIATIVESITDPFATIICTALSFILILIAARIVLSILFAIVNKIVDTGFVGVVNRILGCVFTTALAFLVCWGIAAVFELVIHLPVFEGQAWVGEFGGGFVYKFFKSISPLEMLLSF